MCKFEIYVYTYLCIRSFNLNFRYMATRKQTYIHTYTRDSQCNHASVGLAQARPNKMALTHGIATVWNAHTQSPGRMAQLSEEGKLTLSLKYCTKEQAATEVTIQQLSVRRLCSKKGGAT